MFERLDEIQVRYEKVLAELNDPATASNHNKLRELGKAERELREIVEAYGQLKAAKSEADSAREMLSAETDPEMKSLAEEELTQQETRANELDKKLRLLLVPKDPNDDRNVVVEVKAGEGGDESALFAGDLYKMYERYAERQNWKTEVLSSNPSDLGGFKEITFGVQGKQAFGRLKHEAGVHRVQRVPETESQGRIHTSAVGVMVMPEADEIEVEIGEDDLQIDVFRSSGPGGQSVNTTDSAVRITHKPTGIVVSCQDEKSQIQNRAKGMLILRSRLYNMELERRAAEDSKKRKAQVAAVDRSQKIRTYNFPQNRVTDHRVGISSHNLQGVLEGQIDEFIDALVTKLRSEQLSGSEE